MILAGRKGFQGCLQLSITFQDFGLIEVEKSNAWVRAKTCSSRQFPDNAAQIA